MKRIRLNRFWRRYLSSIVTGIITCAVVAGILFLPVEKKVNPEFNLAERSSVNAICELATLKSYYHNVAMYEEKPDGGNKFMNDFVFWPFGGYIKVGYKQFWLEYSGIVETGIDAGLIQINKANTNGVVQVYVPDAKVLNVYADENSLTEPLSEQGWFTTISGKNKADAFAAAQSAMRQEAEGDQALLRKAKDNAKLLLERYILAYGKETGADLSVSWLDNPL